MLRAYDESMRWFNKLERIRRLFVVETFFSRIHVGPVPPPLPFAWSTLRMASPEREFLEFNVLDIARSIDDQRFIRRLQFMARR